MNSSSPPPDAAADTGKLFDSPAFADRLAGKIALISSMPDPGEACALLKNIAGELGCESSAFATFLQNDPWHQTYRFLLACHPGWCALYQRLAWFADDPWLLYARANSSPAKDVDIPCRTAKQFEIVALARRFDVQSALVVPAPASGGLTRIGVLMLGSSKPGYFDSAHFAKLRILARSVSFEFLDWYTAFVREELRRTCKLSDIDIELLKFERAGLSSKEIFRSTGISAVSVDSRFQRLIARLKVPNRRAASQLAAEYGLI